MAFSPGLRYLSRQLPQLLAPALVLFFSNSLCGIYLDKTLPLPTWATFLLYALISPAYFTAMVQYRDWKDRRAARQNGAPMPPVVPLSSIGGLDFLFAKRDAEFPAEFVGSRAQELGSTFNIRILFQNRVFTSEPENIKAILATEFNTFEKGAQFRTVAEPLLGSGVFASDGDMWKFHRQMTRPFFHRERISDFELFDHHAENAINRIKARLRDGFPIDFQDVVSRFTMDAATSFLFGHDVHSLDAGLPFPGPHYTSSNIPALHETTSEEETNPDSDAFSIAFQAAQTIIGRRNRFGAAWPLSKDEFWVDGIKRPMGVVRRFLDPILKDGVRRAVGVGGGIGGRKDDYEVSEGESLLDHLVKYTQDQTILRDEILNISVAGRDTTASLLTFTIYMLAEHPQVLSTLRAEIQRVVGPNQRPSYDDFREMKYLRAVLNETLRLYSPVTGTTPLYIPAGTRVLFSTLVMHRRPDLWGPDALEFDPDRFLDERLHKYLTSNPFVFLPFSAGPRICLGQQFAYNEASFFLVRLLQSFSSISLAPDAQPPESLPPASWRDPAQDVLGAHLTLFVMGGLWVRMGEVETGDHE
ncbi:cytochrome P450 monooxygenase pc-3 [Mycena amicta]|nr:cytochrome P450 monooxygenase pc-3 [Mycena amicta]